MTEHHSMIIKDTFMDTSIVMDTIFKMYFTAMIETTPTEIELKDVGCLTIDTICPQMLATMVFLMHARTILAMKEGMIDTKLGIIPL